MIKRASGDGTLSDVTNVAMVVNKDAGIGGNQVKLQFFNDTTKVVDVDDDSTIKYASLNVGSLYEYSISGGKYSFENLAEDFGLTMVISPMLQRVAIGSESKAQCTSTTRLRSSCS